MGLIGFLFTFGFGIFYVIRLHQMYKLLPQFENNPAAQQQLPKNLSCFRWVRIISYVITLISFVGIFSAIIQYEVFKYGNILQVIVSILIVFVIVQSVYGICLTCCLNSIFNMMKAGQGSPSSNAVNNRSVTYVDNAPYQPDAVNNTLDDEANSKANKFKAFKGKGQKIG